MALSFMKLKRKKKEKRKDLHNAFLEKIEKLYSSNMKEKSVEKSYENSYFSARKTEMTVQKH